MCFSDRFLQQKFIWVSYHRVFQIAVRGGRGGGKFLPPSGGIRNFTGGGIFLLGERNRRRSDFNDLVGGGGGDFSRWGRWANFWLVGETPTVRKTLRCAIFGFTWSTIVVFMILQKPHVLGKSFSSYIQKCSQPITLQDFLSFNVTKAIWGIKFIFWM